LGATNSGTAGTIKVVLSAIIGNGIITVLKFIAWAVTFSPSMLAEAIHSFADTSNQLLLFVGLKHSDAQASEEHPFGYGSASYVWNLISAMGIFFVGFGVTTYHGVHSLLHLGEYTGESWSLLPIGVFVLAFIIEGYVFMIAFVSAKKDKKQLSWSEYMRKGDDPAKVAVLLEDGVAVFGVVVALVGIFLSHLFQTNLPDAIASIVIGVLLGVLAVMLVRANARLLMGASAGAMQDEKIRSFLEEHAFVEKISSLKTEILGPRRLRLTVEVEFHGEQMINRDQIIKDAERIRSGDEDPLPILVSTSERMVRTMGKQINEIEHDLRQKFPSLDVIELEVN